MCFIIYRWYIRINKLRVSQLQNRYLHHCSIEYVVYLTAFEFGPKHCHNNCRNLTHQKYFIPLYMGIEELFRCSIVLRSVAIVSVGKDTLQHDHVLLEDLQDVLSSSSIYSWNCISRRILLTRLPFMTMQIKQTCTSCKGLRYCLSVQHNPFKLCGKLIILS